MSLFAALTAVGIGTAKLVVEPTFTVLVVKDGAVH